MESQYNNDPFELVPLPVYNIFHDKFESHQYSDFLYRFQKILWFSYRKNFQPILHSKKNKTETIFDLVENVKSEIRTIQNNSRLTFTTDQGWGCMLRCAQMMIAEALIRTKNFDKIHLLSHFLDNENAPFSIHQMVISGNNFGKLPGEWYGPNTVSHVMKERLLRNSSQKDTKLNVLIVDQGVIYEDHLKTNQLILIPHRLGVHSINPEYFDEIRYLLRFPSSVGILGGTPNHALYIVGSVDKPESIMETNNLICLDPHVVQNVVADTEPISLETYVCKEPKRVNITNLDPSMAFGFYLDENPESIIIFKSLIKNSTKIITMEPFEPKWKMENIIDEFELL